MLSEEVWKTSNLCHYGDFQAADIPVLLNEQFPSQKGRQTDMTGINKCNEKIVLFRITYYAQKSHCRVC